MGVPRSLDAFAPARSGGVGHGGPAIPNPSTPTPNHPSAKRNAPGRHEVEGAVGGGGEGGRGDFFRTPASGKAFFLSRLRIVVHVGGQGGRGERAIVAGKGGQHCWPGVGGGQRQ